MDIEAEDDDFEGGFEELLMNERDLRDSRGNVF